MIHQELDSLVLKNMKHQRVLTKGVKKVKTQNPLVITAIRKDILLMFAGLKGPINTIHIKIKGIVISETCKDIRYKTIDLKKQEKKYFMVTDTISISIDIDLLSANQSLCGHQISMQKETTMHTINTGTKTLGKVVTIIKSMDIYLKSTLEHILKETTTDG